MGVNHLDIFEHIAAHTTETMDSAVRQGKVSGQNARRYYQKAVTAKEILIVLALQIVFFKRRDLSTIEQQFMVFPAGRDSFPMKKKRYSAIVSCLSADFEELAGLLRTSWQDAIDPGTVFCVDETMYSYHSKDPTSPGRYIPRKPHSNGLLSYTAAFKTDKGPFVFDISPDWKYNEPLNGRACLRDMVERWAWPDEKHVVFDAGFSGEQQHHLLNDLGCLFTASVNQAHKRWLVDLLKKHCRQGQHIVVVDQFGMIWSFARDQHGDAEHLVISNAFKASAKMAREAAINSEQTKAFARMGLRGLSLLADMLHIPAQADDIALATSIAAAINLRVPSVPVAPAPANAGLPAQNGDAQPQQEDLKKKTVPQLKELGKQLGLNKLGSMKKPELVQRIGEAQAIRQDAIETVKRDLEAGSRGGTQFLHTQYVQTFNGIDLHDRTWYALQNHHAIVHWRAKFVMGLMMSGVVNAAIVYKFFFEDVRKRDFVFALADQLLWE